MMFLRKSQVSYRSKLFLNAFLSLSLLIFLSHPVRAQNIQYNNQDETPSVKINPIELKQTVTIPIFIKINSPTSESKLTEGSNVPIEMSYGGDFDQSLPGTYYYRLELWRNGSKLGNLSNIDRFNLNIKLDSFTDNWDVGTYLAKDPQTNRQKIFTAQAGDGYVLKAVIVQGQSTDHGTVFTDLVSGDSSSLTLESAPQGFSQKDLVPIGDFSVVPGAPKDGDSFKIGGDNIDLPFDYSGPFRKEQGGLYRYYIELWKDGKKLGNVSNIDTSQLNYKVNHGSGFAIPGRYFSPDPNTGVSKVREAPAGNGYQFRIVLAEWYNGPQGETETKDLTEAMTGKFSLQQASVTMRIIRSTEMFFQNVILSINGAFKQLKF